jgi:hypothetical protein
LLGYRANARAGLSILQAVSQHALLPVIASMPDVVQSALWSMTNAGDINGLDPLEEGRELPTFLSQTAQAG